MKNHFIQQRFILAWMCKRVITTLVNQNQNEGYQSVQFNGSDLPDGVYFYSIEAGKYRDIKKLIILK